VLDCACPPHTEGVKTGTSSTTVRRAPARLARGSTPAPPQHRPAGSPTPAARGKRPTSSLADLAPATTEDRAREAIAASERRYASILEGTAEAILIAEASSGRLRWVNRAACSLLGYTRDELLSMRVQDLHPSADRTLVLTQFAAIVEDQLSENLAVPCLRKDGSVLLANVRASTAVVDGVPCNIGFFTDVTELHRLDQELRRSRRNLAEAQRIAGIGSWEWDLTTGTAQRSDQLHRIYGIEPGSLTPAFDAFHGYVHPEDRARVKESEAAALLSPDGRYAFDYRIIRQDGSVRTIHDEAEVVRDSDGRAIRLVGTTQDITERIRAEVERSRLSTAVAQTSESVVITDLTGAIEYVNPAFERMTGYRREDALGQNPRILKSGRQSDAFYQALWRRLTGGQSWTGRFVNRRADGDLYHAEATISPFRDGDGQLVGYIGVERDVTALQAARTGLADEFRERAQIAAALGRLQPGPSASATAAEICGELSALPGIDLAAILNFVDGDHATTLGVVAPPGAPLGPGRRLPVSRARYLYERALLGPWAETYRPRQIDRTYGQAMAEIGMRAFAYAPIRNGEGLLGLVGVGTCDETYARHLVEHLPAVGEFAATASALLARDLEGDHARSRLHTLIQGIIAERRFQPVYQPIVDLIDDAVVGYEALTRFDDGTRPDHRLADAWATDLGAELELATLDMAIFQARALPAGRWLDVNVSPRLLQDPTRIRTALAKADRPVVLEITEHDQVTDYRVLVDAIRSLGETVRTAVDDAGAGIANFSHIIEIRPDFVKLDIGLVRGVNSDLGRQAMVIGMRHFARTAGCRLIGEGAETEAEARSLKSLGVDFGQGYYFGRPETIEALVAKRGET
jgi:PAS domain S-box-containing protein